MKKLSLFDKMFLSLETKEQKMHVVGLSIFEKPKHHADSYIDNLLIDMQRNPWPFPRAHDKLFRSYQTLGRLFWLTDDNIDMAHHINADSYNKRNSSS